jgi:hypothetical protein
MTSAGSVTFKMSSVNEAGSREQDPAYICALAPRRTLRALGPLRTLRTIRSLWTIRALGPLRTIATFGPLRTIRSVAPVSPLRTIRACGTLGSDGSLLHDDGPLIGGGDLAEHGPHVARRDRPREHEGQDDS